jgi:hypothetical protein
MALTKQDWAALETKANQLRGLCLNECAECGRIPFAPCATFL